MPWEVVRGGRRTVNSGCVLWY